MRLSLVKATCMARLVLDQCQKLHSSPAPAQSNSHWQDFMPSCFLFATHYYLRTEMAHLQGIILHLVEAYCGATLDGLSCFAVVAITHTIM